MIPVLVGGASVPPAQQLPASIQDLSYRHAIVIRPNPDFHRDMDRLIDHLRTQLDGKKEQLASPKAQSTVSDVSGTERIGHSEAERPGEEAAEVKARSSEPDSEAEAVNPEHEERATPSAALQATTDGSSSFLLVGLGLIVLIGAVAAFLILQPKSSPVYSPPVVEKKEERQAQVIPPPAPPRSAEPVVAQKKQENPVEKPVSARQSAVPTPEMIQISAGSFMMGGSGNRVIRMKRLFTKSDSPNPLRSHGMKPPFTSTTVLRRRLVANCQATRAGGAVGDRSSM